MTARPGNYVTVDNNLRRPIPGRRPIRHSRPSQATTPDTDQISVQADPDPDVDGKPARTWTVTLRCGTTSIIVGQHLGRFGTAALTDQLHRLLNPGQQQGGAID